MPSLGILFFFIFILGLIVLTIVTFLHLYGSLEIENDEYLAYIWAIPVTAVFALQYFSFPINKERIVGVYRIDSNFYPGKNADWQHEHFSFEITENDDFIFFEKLRDGTQKPHLGKVIWLREREPMLYRIVMDDPHPLVDEYPTLYRGNRKFYYVFESKFGNMFYRKNK